MRVLLLGTGTSSGVPAIGCKCAVCTSSDPKDKRLRPSALVETKGVSILIDTAPDLRQQALQFGVNRLDAVLYTHDHADHLHGIDDLRAFNFIQWAQIPVYGNIETIERIRKLFDYIFDPNRSEGGGKPMIETCVITGPFEVKGVKIEPLRVFHGSKEILAFRIGPFAYLTDVSSIPSETIDRIRGVDLLVLDALRHKAHPTHMNFEQAVACAKEIGARRTLLTHFSHSATHKEISEMMPEGIEPAYDGMEIILDEK